MPDQDWKRDGWKWKYVIRKVCKACAGRGYYGRPVGDLHMACPACEGAGSTAVDCDALYFVLRLDGHHDPHARVAMKAYADSVRAENPKFADDIAAKLERAT